MFENFKKNLKKNRLAKRSVHVERNLSFQNFQTARACLLFGVEGSVSALSVENLRAMLAERMEVEVLILVGEKERPAVEEVKGAVYVNEGDISFSGKFVHARLHEMMHRSYDLLIDLSRGPDHVGDYLLRFSMAKCKIGMERGGFQCDIVFEGVEEVGVLQDRLSELLEKIKTHS
ncbi:MAG: hypothetical protein LBP56_08005 [Odoribacteraceae bacterium]|jgi:hypothetical protein|nr:hypothetical protein [Odoribacteraceae bacterium]